MARHDRRTARRQPPTSRSVSVQVRLPVLAVLGDVRQAFHRLCIATGTQLLQACRKPTGTRCVARRDGTNPSGPRGVVGAWRAT